MNRPQDFRYSAIVHHHFPEYKAPVTIAIIHDDRCQDDVVHLAINGWIVAALSKVAPVDPDGVVDNPFQKFADGVQENMDKVLQEYVDKTNVGVDPTIGGIKDPVKKLKRLREQYDILNSHCEELKEKINLIYLDIQKIQCEISGNHPHHTTIAEVNGLFDGDGEVDDRPGFVPERDWPRKL